MRESCPVFPGDPEHIHWSFPDPVVVTGPTSARERASRHGDPIDHAVNYLLLMIDKKQIGEEMKQRLLILYGQLGPLANGRRAGPSFGRRPF